LSPGRFITFEGGDGVGKSTQARLLVDSLGKIGIAAIQTREPGGSPGAEAIRKILLSGDAEAWDAESEALLMVAARRDHLRRTIRPVLEAGKWVVCDRFSDSTEAYQGYGRGLPRDVLAALHRLIAGDFAPDLTVILDLPVEQGLKRAASANRFERMGTDFHRRMAEGFREIARREPKRCVLIDGGRNIPAVQADIATAVGERLGIKLPT
jgi:dTMP kinase